MRVLADRELCVGSGTCELLAPDAFAVGDDGVVEVLGPEPGTDEQDAVRDAVAQCPTGALALAD